MSKTLLLGLLVGLFVYVVCTVGDSPVVFKSRAGEMCGCIVDDDYPTLGQCDRVKQNKPYEVIFVSKCN